jgi:hypothetical protein
MLFGLLIGFAVGLNAGLWFATFLWRKVHKDDVAYYSKRSDEWFNEYLKVRGYYNEMTSMYYQEVLKNISK